MQSIVTSKGPLSPILLPLQPRPLDNSLTSLLIFTKVQVKAKSQVKVLPSSQDLILLTDSLCQDHPSLIIFITFLLLLLVL